MKAQQRKKYFFITAFFLIFVANFPDKLGFDVTVNKNKDSESKTILLWNTFFRDKTFGLRYELELLKVGKLLIQIPLSS